MDTCEDRRMEMMIIEILVKSIGFILMRRVNSCAIKLQYFVIYVSK